MGEKRQILLTEEPQILYMYMGIHIIVCISPLQERELHLPLSLCLDLMIHFQRKESGKGKSTFTMKKSGKFYL